jgi:dienelactone hydrolase
MSRTRRLPTPAGPAEQGVHGDLAYTLWRPEGHAWGGMVVIHGAGSCKENHHDMARAARAAGMAAVCFDLRDPLDARVLDDVAAIASLVPRPLALRGSSLGGYLAIAAAEQAGAAAVVAICPAGADGLSQLFPGLAGFFAEHDLGLIVEQSTTPLMLIHAQGDERVPYQHSVMLHERSAAPTKRLLVMPGGHHRSIQHDAELQGESLRFVRRALGA